MARISEYTSVWSYDRVASCWINEAHDISYDVAVILQENIKRANPRALVVMQDEKPLYPPLGADD